MDVSSSSPVPPARSLQHKKVLVFLVAVIVTVGVVAYVYLLRFNAAKDSATQVAAPLVVEGQKTDFGTVISPNFPTNILLEKEIQVTQSYSLDYPDQKQLTAVFASQVTVKQNYDKYADFLKKENWTTLNSYESESISSLYGTKDNSDINITITASETEPTTSSNVSISVLKK